MADVLAVDLGKTACRAAWRGEMADGPGAAGLAAPGGVAAAEAAILAVCGPLLRGGTVELAGVAVAGALAAPDAARALARCLCDSLPAARVALCSDAVAAHAGALAGQPGVVLSVGTGAVATAVGPDGVAYRVDGWGAWLGDAGGGAWLGRRGLRAALRAWDGRGPPTLLQDAAVARFGALDTLPAAVEGGANPARTLASFAPDVVAAAASGDAVAAALLDAAAGALADTAAAAAARVPAGLPVTLTGGLASVLAERVAARLGAALHPPRGTALDGAVLLACDPVTVHEGAVHRAAAVPRHALDGLATEGMQPGLDDLDLRGPGAVVHLVLAAERSAGDALNRAAPALAAAADAVAARMAAGGRLFYLGAGTPGRLATLDAAELGPTFNAPPGLVVPLLAGGPAAMLEAAEGAEDDTDAAGVALDAHGLAAGDCVVGITASGRTPFVVAGLAHAARRGALTVAVVNNPRSPAAAAAALAVEILTGAELIAGSTRMAAGTAQKIALNALSTAVMVAAGKTYGARMVDVRATNAKLRRRAARIVREVTGVTEADAAAALAASGGRVKPALVALLAKVDPAEAERRLQHSGGRVRQAVAR